MERRDTATTSERSRPAKKRWLVASGVCLLAATFFLLRGNADVAFVASVLGALAWFFDVRGRLMSKDANESSSAKADSEFEDDGE